MQAATMRISSVPHPKGVIYARSNALLRSGRLFAVPAASESSPEEEKRSNRISKKERRELLQAFVERYRALNAGRFPTITHAQKEIGGSYYVVREVILELKYNDKVSPLKTELPADFGTRPDVGAGWNEDPLLKDGEVDEPSSQLASEAYQTMQSNKHIVEGTENFGASRQASFEDQDGEADGLSAVKEPLFSVDLDKPMVEEPTNYLTKVTSQSGNHTAEGTGNSSLSKQTSSENYIDIEAVTEDTLRSAMDKLTDKIEDSTKDQDACVSMKLKTELNASETMDHDMQGNNEDKSSSADSLISAKLEIEVKKFHPVADDLQGTSEDERYIESAKGGKQISNEEISTSDKFTADNSKLADVGAPSAKGWSIWGNLKYLAGGIINLWRK